MGFISPVATDTNGNPRQTGSLQTLGKDDFLQLLVTKLQHQDPLKPMDDEDFIAQLAQFSSLEQMNNISEGIATSNKWDFLQMQSLNNVMASGLIGREVTADFSGLYVDATNQPVISFTLSEPAARIEFEVRDEQGNLVTTITSEDVPMGIGSVKWDGKDSFGNRVAEGYYTVSARAETDSGATFTPSLVGDIRSIGQPEED